MRTWNEYKSELNESKSKSIKKYKGYEILDANGVIIVKGSDGTEFIVSLDDSKSSGNRESVEADVKDAMNYIDYVTKLKAKKSK